MATIAILAVGELVHASALNLFSNANLALFVPIAYFRHQRSAAQQRVHSGSDIMMDGYALAILYLD